MGPSLSSISPLSICFAFRFDDGFMRDLNRERTTRICAATRAACAPLIKIAMSIGGLGRGLSGIYALRTTGGSTEPSAADAREAQVSDQSHMGLYRVHYQCNSGKGLVCTFPSLDTVANRRVTRYCLGSHSNLPAVRPQKP